MNQAVGSLIFAPLPTIAGGRPCILSDVPADFRANSIARPGRNARRHYACHTMKTLAALPVRDVAARNAFLFFCVTGPFLAIGAHVPVMKAWGFAPTAIGFTWAKLNPNAPALFFGARDFAFGGGLTTRKNCEFVILGKRGRPKRPAADVRELIIAPRREHSRKPDELYERIERYCAGPRLDLFGRQSRSGWAVYGDEAGKFDAPTIGIPPVLGAAP
jgi:N6-adenosine-specific RNA methylase IME4